MEVVKKKRHRQPARRSDDPTDSVGLSPNIEPHSFGSMNLTAGSTNHPADSCFIEIICSVGSRRQSLDLSSMPDAGRRQSEF
jgi:hypothetical protein